MKIALIMDLKRAEYLSRALECFARIGSGQFADMVETLDPKATWDKRHSIEATLKAELTPELAYNESRGVGNKLIPKECAVSWDAYQALRREVAWMRDGKDWRTGKLGDNMSGVQYREPMFYCGLEGKGFETERVEDGDKQGKC